MRIGYFADGPWGQLALKKILADDSLRVIFITLRYNNPDKRIVKIAKEHSIPIEQSKNINSAEYLNRISKYNAEIFVSMSFDQIFKAETYNIPVFKTINCHAGKLPYYRGRNILNWALINDEKEFGITVHYVDEGIDTGDIILQDIYPITDEDDYGTLLNRAYDGCADILYRAIKKIQDNSVTRVKQKDISPVGMYCGKRDVGDEILNWNQTSREVFNFVRAISKPGPQARSWIDGKEIQINKVRLIEGAPIYKNNPGQILQKTKSGFLVKTKDTFVEVIEYTFDGKIKVGSRLINHA